MKSAKPPATESASHRRSQPARQARTNPSRTSASGGRSNGGRDSISGQGDQPIEIFPAITFFADVMTALPKELVRHFTLLREVDAKLYAPEEQLFQLVSQVINTPAPDPRMNNGASSIAGPSSAPMSAQNSSSGSGPNNGVVLPSAADSNNTLPDVFDSSNIPRRQLFRQTALKLQEMIGSLEEKNHVLGNANEALQKQLARIEDVWPYLENEFSEEAKWGSVSHWAYPENRTGKAQSERTRREGAAAISAAAEALAAEVAARTDARKQALQAKKSQRHQIQESDFDDHENRAHKSEGTKKTGQGKSRKTAENNNVGLGITTTANTNGNPPSKKRKVESNTNGLTTAERPVIPPPSAVGRSRPPVTSEAGADGPPKKRKALPTSSTQAKKKNGVVNSPSVTSSPVIPPLPEPKGGARASPTPNNMPRPTTSRARQNSLQSGEDNGKPRPTSIPPAKPNGVQPAVPEGIAVGTVPRASSDSQSIKEPSVPSKAEPPKEETDKTENGRATPPVPAKKDTKPEGHERRKSESIPPITQTMVTVTTKSGRASKPSTPALAAFQEAPRPRLPRNHDSSGNKKNQKKTAPTPQTLAPPSGEDDLTSGEGDIDADEPLYCYCNGVSYGEMVACDSDSCTREWFHLNCVGLKVAPAGKWYCTDCKEQLKIGNRKANGR